MVNKVTEFVVFLDESSRKRHYHESQNGKVSYFAVQLEVKVIEVWRVVIRYDCAHDFAHIDRYDIYGKQNKEILDLDFANALTYGDLDINRNWLKYKTEFLKQLK
jgi:hypothetical protein